jgi:hypothetical protein
MVEHGKSCGRTGYDLQWVTGTDSTMVIPVKLLAHHTFTPNGGLAPSLRPTKMDTINGFPKS